VTRAVSEMAIEVLADSELGLAESAARWRAFALEVMAQNAEMQGAIDQLKFDYELTLDEYYHLLHSSKGLVRADHETLCRRHRDLLREVAELYELRDEYRQFLQRGAA
jgi:hypothetical protein